MIVYIDLNSIISISIHFLCFYVADFGDDLVRELSDHFSSTLEEHIENLTGLQAEWDLLKTLLYNHHDNFRNKTWSEINILFSEKCPNILVLFDLILSMPASSAICERGFSAMKQLKTEYRNRLSS